LSWQANGVPSARGLDNVLEVSSPRDTVGEVCRERARARCWSRDGGRPSEAGLQEQASNSRKLRWSRAIVVSVTGKGVINHVM